MFAHLKGFIENIGASHLVLDVNGVGYMVFASKRSLDALTVGEEAKLYIETHIREDHIHLYGFVDRLEQEWYCILTTVQGVGARVCLAILSASSPDQMTQAIMAQDKTAFTQADGVGPKLGARIVNELKDKVAKLPTSVQGLSMDQVSIQPSANTDPLLQNLTNDAVSALVNLGYKKYDAYGAVMRLQKSHQPTTIDEFIRLGLKELSA